MSKSQLRRMDEIESWRAKAYSLSRVDRIGRLLTKSFELIQTVVSDGPKSERLSFEIECVIRENTKEMNDDLNKDEVLRSMLYGLNLSMASMIESIIERLEERVVESAAELMPMVEETKTEALDDFSASENYEFDTFDAIQQGIIDDDPFLNMVKEEDEEAAASGLLTPIFDYFSPDAVPTASGTVPNDFSEEDKEGQEDKAGPSTNKRLRSSRSPKGKKAKTSRSIDGDAEEGNQQAKHGDMNGEEKEKDSDWEVGSEVFHCRKCGKEFESEHALGRHTFVHKAFKCKECGLRLRTREKLDKHYTDLHPGKAPPPPSEKKKVVDKADASKCTICDTQFRFPYQLKRHLLTHTGEKPFVCVQCNAAFFIRKLLNVHLRDVHAVKPFGCKYCGERFEWHTELMAHTKIHVVVKNEI